MDYLSVKEAADYLGVTRGRVNQLINTNLLKAEKVGAYWVVERKSVEERKKSNPQPGRPW